MGGREGRYQIGTGAERPGAQRGAAAGWHHHACGVKVLRMLLGGVGAAALGAQSLRLGGLRLPGWTRRRCCRGNRMLRVLRGLAPGDVPLGRPPLRPELQ